MDSTLCWLAPATTRSSASLGRTYNFMPTKAPVMATPKKMMTTMIGMTLYLDVHNLAHDAVADQLQRDGAAQHDLADVIGEKELDVIRIGVEHQHRDGHRNQRQGRGRHFSVRADGADAAAQLEALANHVCEFVQN